MELCQAAIRIEGKTVCCDLYPDHVDCPVTPLHVGYTRIDDEQTLIEVKWR